MFQAWRASLLLLLCFTVVLCTASKSSSCPLNLVKGTTILFVADPGGFSGIAEAQYYLANLHKKVEIPTGATACASAYTGIIMRQHVAVITTGIGPTASALCVYDVVSNCGTLIRDMFYSGTSGWSSQLGGVINNGTCSSGVANTNTADIARLGDVCVSPFSVNWDCRLASWDMTSAGTPNQCTFPAQQNGPADSNLFGQCQFADVSARELAFSDEVLAAATARSGQLPARTAIIQSLEEAYWAKMSEGTGVSYPASELSRTAPSRLWGYKQCMEVDTQYFWSGAPWDMVSRAYVADTLNRGLGSSNYDQTNVIGVSAMEAIGVSMAMSRYNALSTTQRRIPYTVVRGMSDWVHTPLSKQGNAPQVTWAAGPAVENFAAGYQYAVATASSVVLSTLQARCQKMGADTSTAPPAAKPGSQDASAAYRSRPCTYTINLN